MTDNIELGDIAKDDLTGFEGVVVSRTFWLTNCDRLSLQPKALKDGEPAKAQSFDITRCTLVTKAAHAAGPRAIDTRPEIALGDTARDTITGFEGIVLARCVYLSAGDHLVLQPQKLDKDGQPQKTSGFDVSHCALVAKLQPPAPPEKRGGPMDDVRRRADPVRS